MNKHLSKMHVILFVPLLFLAISAGAMVSTKLGDLSKFKTIAVDVQILVSQNKLIDAKKRIKDLETKWDEAEAGIKPRAGGDWRMLDKKVDSALDALREDHPDQKNCQLKMNELLQTFNQLEK